MPPEPSNKTGNRRPQRTGPLAHRTALPGSRTAQCSQGGPSQEEAGPAGTPPQTHTWQHACNREGHTRAMVTSNSFWIIWAWVPWKGSPSTSMPTLPVTPLRISCRTRMLIIFSSLSTDGSA